MCGWSREGVRGCSITEIQVLGVAHGLVLRAQYIRLLAQLDLTAFRRVVPANLGNLPLPLM